MQELSKEQIERANAELAAMADGWILSAEGWRDIAPHLQYAPAPVDGDVLEQMYQAHIMSSAAGAPCMRGPYNIATQVLQSRHDAEYKKALGPVTDEEYNTIWKLSERDFGNELLAGRRALLERKPEPTLKDEFVASLYRIRGDQDEPTNAELADELLLFVERRSKA